MKYIGVLNNPIKSIKLFFFRVVEPKAEMAPLPPLWFTHGTTNTLPSEPREKRLKPEGFFRRNTLTAAIIPGKIGITLFRRNTLLFRPLTLDIDTLNKWNSSSCGPLITRVDIGEERINKALATNSGIVISLSMTGCIIATPAEP